MFKSKTVFIIGAGASCEAGLPSGAALKKDIAKLLNIRFDEWNQISGDHQIVQAFREATKGENGQRGNINPFLEKAWHIRDIVPTLAISIDNFLDAHRGDKSIELCGKLGIVRGILNAESRSKLKAADRENSSEKFSFSLIEGTWYQGFFNMLTENVARSEVESVFENVSIITFNYDRCIERFLKQALQDYYSLSETEATDIASKLTIIHPYGNVGSLRWQVQHVGVPFGSQQANLLAIAKQIKTFTEGMDDEVILRKMHHEIASANTIVFLGFAFHPSNMRLLTPKYPTAISRVFATTWELSDADERVIETDILKMIGKSNIESPYLEALDNKPILVNATCGVFFQKYFRSLSS